MRRPALALATVLLLAPGAASAQQVSDADRATARSLAQQGQDALDRKDYKTAADRFDRARQLIPAPTLSLGLARAEVGLGSWIAAHETYSRILREGVGPHAPEVFTKAVADARAELEALEPRMPSVVIEVKGAPSARVTLDGAPVPAAALGVNRPVDPGPHAVHADADGFAPTDASFTSIESKSERITLTLVPAAREVAPAPSPASTGGVPAPPRSGSPQKAIGIGAISVGGAGLLVGAITGAVAMGKHGELASMCPGGHCTDDQPAIDGYHLVANVSTVGFVVGGALAATGVVLVATAPKAPAVAVTAGPGWLGARVRF